MWKLAVIAALLILVPGCQKETTARSVALAPPMVQDPSVVQYCADSLGQIAVDLDRRPSIPRRYLADTISDLEDLGATSMTDPKYSDLLTRVQVEMWQIGEYEKDDAI